MSKRFKIPKISVAFRAVVLYLVISILWILLSDTIVFSLNLDPDTIEYIQKIKGLAFVSISTIILYLVIHAGIAKQEMIFSSLMNSEKRFRLLIDNLNEYAIFMLDPSGNILSWNKGAEEITGFSGEEILGKSFSVFCDFSIPDHTDPSFALQEAKNKGRYHEESMKMKKDGNQFWASCTLTAVVDEKNKVIGYAQVIQDFSERRRNAEKEKKYNEQLMTLTNYLQTSVEEERSRISREIHDDLGQRMTVLRMDASLLAKVLEPVQNDIVQEIVKKELPSMTHMIDEAIQSVRKIIRDLRPEVLDTLGLLNGLRWQADEFTKRTKIPVSLRLPDEKMKFNSKTSTTLFRVFQEALTNIARHAQATQVFVEFIVADDSIRFTVQDNGKGITREEKNKANSFGLLGVRERARALGGVMSIEPEPQKGTILTVVLPYRE